MSNGSTTAAPSGVARLGASMPPAYCRMFLDARRILGLADWELAQRLGTDVVTIRALEAGHLSALPPWPETSRIVTAYLGGLGLDARPVLHSLSQDLVKLAAAPQGQSNGRERPAAGARTGRTQSHSAENVARNVSARPVSATKALAKAAIPNSVPRKTAIPGWVVKFGRAPRAVNYAVTTAARSAMTAGQRATRRMKDAGQNTTGRGDRGGRGTPRRRKGLRAVIAAAVCALLVVAVAKTSVAGSVMTAAAAPLPVRLTQAFGQVADMIRVKLAPVRDGLRWIEVENPRSRRGDKLQTARR